MRASDHGRKVIKAQKAPTKSATAQVSVEQLATCEEGASGIVKNEDGGGDVTDMRGVVKNGNGVVVMVNGMALQLATSSRNNTGYKKVMMKAQDRHLSTPYSAEDDNNRLIGKYATAVEAALAYAQWVAGAACAGYDDSLTIHADNDKSGDERRWLVSRVGSEESKWEPAYTLPKGNVEEWEVTCREQKNKAWEGVIGTAEGSGNPYWSLSLSQTGVEPCSVAAQDASSCADFLRSNWVDGMLQLTKRRKIRGYSSYGKVLEAHNPEEQRTHTLLFTNATLPIVRLDVPGFEAMERSLARWLLERFGTVVELYFAHGLRQSPETLAATGFDVHQDTEEFDFIMYTVVVKLTPDTPHEPPSAMRVLGAAGHYYYGPSTGAAGCFRAKLYHASVPPTSQREHLKIAFFFRASDQAERRVERTIRRQRALAREASRSSSSAVASTRDDADEPMAVHVATPPSSSSSSRATVAPSTPGAAQMAEEIEQRTRFMLEMSATSLEILAQSEPHYFKKPAKKPKCGGGGAKRSWATEEGEGAHGVRHPARPWAHSDIAAADMASASSAASATSPLAGNKVACPKCGRVCTNNGGFAKHVKACTGAAVAPAEEQKEATAVQPSERQIQMRMHGVRLARLHAEALV